MSCRQSKVVTRSRSCSSSALRAGDVEAHPVADARVRGPLARRLDRALVVVRADERAGRERLAPSAPSRRRGRSRGRRPAHPRSSFAGDAVQRRDPLGKQVHQVAGPEEPLAAGEDVLRRARASRSRRRCGTRRSICGHRLAAHRARARTRRAGRSARRGRSARTPAPGVIEYVAAAGVVLDVAAGGLPAQPLVDVARVGAGAWPPARRASRGSGGERRGRGRAARRAARCRRPSSRRGRRRTLPTNCISASMSMAGSSAWCRRRLVDGGHVGSPSAKASGWMLVVQTVLAGGLRRRLQRALQPGSGGGRGHEGTGT